mgnify:CR=1 FL=1
MQAAEGRPVLLGRADGVDNKTARFLGIRPERAADLLREHKVRGSWVLIFNAGQDDEGLYTLQGSEASGAQHEGTYVLAFEQLEEASQIALPDEDDADL